MRRLLLVLLAFTLSGCATDSTQSSAGSSIPWNRPESWESGSGIPGFGNINEGR